ncbi:hypothetical protein Plhal703r1_c13g0064451 [Plasmopara halstedii]
MVKVICAIVGAAGNAFPVDIDADQLVGDLKEEIKAKKPNDMKGVDADRLELFLGKTDGGAWLSSQSDDVKKLKKGEKTALIKSLIKEDQQLQAEESLEYVLRENNMATPQSRQIHVLVVVPAGNSVDIGVTPSRLLKYKQQDTDAGSYMRNSSQFLYRLSLPSLMCNTGRIQPTKKDV